jgi:hypothetical protein
MNNKLFVYLDFLGKKSAFIINIENDHTVLYQEIGYRMEEIILQLVDTRDKITIGLSR